MSPIDGGDADAVGRSSGLAPIIVTALFSRHDHAYFDGLRRAHFPPERNVLSAHLTMFHHLMPSVEDELRRRLRDEVRGVPPPAARIASVFSLGHGTAFRIESPGLEAIRERLAAAFAMMLLPQDAAPWRPHVTIQNKVTPVEARRLLNTLIADFSPRPVAISGLAAWWYRGGPWQPISRHMFR